MFIRPLLSIELLMIIYKARIFFGTFWPDFDKRFKNKLVHTYIEMMIGKKQKLETMKSDN